MPVNPFTVFGDGTASAPKTIGDTPFGQWMQKFASDIGESGTRQTASNPPQGYKLPIVDPDAGRVNRILDENGNLVRVEVINWEGQPKLIPRAAERAGNTYTYRYNGRTVDITFDQNGFPDFSQIAIVDMNLPRNYWFAKDRGSFESQFQYLNRRLAKKIEKNPQLQQQMGLTDRDVAELQRGRNPIGYLWHHHQDFGRMQLVPSGLHRQIGHVGGRDIWGGGNIARTSGRVGEDQYPNSID